MNEPQTIGVIRPEILARKWAAICNYEYPELLKQVQANPRLKEVLWFLQAMSMQPGGLVKFVADITEALPACFGTVTMRAAKRGCESLDLKRLIFAEIPSRYSPEGWPINTECYEDVHDILRNYSANEKLQGGDERRLDQFLKPVSFSVFGDICRKVAKERLPGYLEALCTEIDRGFAPKGVPGIKGGECWYMDDPVQVVTQMMDRQVSEVSKRLAMTEVTKKVFDALDYAMQERRMVRVVGNSRFGKTESAVGFCRMRPGLARVVTVPPGNSLADLHRSFAEALGMDVGYASREQRLKERIEYVLKHSGLLFAFDESAYLVPQNYNSGTAPARLNWVRAALVDRGIPVALVVTPQTFMPMVNRFVKKTGYAMEQFFGRNYRTIELPDELEQCDLLAVARIHFPELEEDYLALVADYALVSENYLQAVEAIASVARFTARRDGRKRITVADIKAAASEVIPRREVAQHDTVQTVPKARLNTPAKRVQTTRRETARQEDFQTSSLRRDGSVRVETGLVPAAA